MRLELYLEYIRKVADTLLELAVGANNIGMLWIGCSKVTGNPLAVSVLNTKMTQPEWSLFNEYSKRFEAQLKDLRPSIAFVFTAVIVVDDGITHFAGNYFKRCSCPAASTCCSSGRQLSVER